MTLMSRRTNPLAEMLGWLDAEGPSLRGLGGAPYVRIEDYLEEDTYVLRAEMPGIDPDKDLDISIDGDVVIKAKYADGVLPLRVPLAGPAVEPRKVPVRRAEG